MSINILTLRPRKLEKHPLKMKKKFVCDFDEMLSVPRALCVKSWLKTSLKIGKIPIFTPLEGSEAVKLKKQKCQAPQNTCLGTFLLYAYY